MKSIITIDVELDEGRTPQTISWSATDSSIDSARKSQSDDAFFLGWCRQNLTQN
jgi:hypothetical protein